MSAPFLTADWSGEKPNEIRFSLDRRITHNERADLHRAVLVAVQASSFGVPAPRVDVPLPMRQAMNEGAHKRAILQRQADEAASRKFAAAVAKRVHGARSSTATVGFTRSELVELLIAAHSAGRADGLRQAADNLKGLLA